MYGIAITYGVVSLLLLGGFAYLTFKMTSKKWNDYYLYEFLMKINSQGWSLIFSIGTIVITFFVLDKEDRRKKYKSMSSKKRQELILKKMKTKGIEVGSGVPNKKYDNEEVYELIHIANCFPELREKDN